MKTGYKSNYSEKKLLIESEITKRCRTLETKWGCAAQVLSKRSNLIGQVTRSLFRFKW